MCVHTLNKKWYPSLLTHVSLIQCEITVVECENIFSQMGHEHTTYMHQHKILLKVSEITYLMTFLCSKNKGFLHNSDRSSLRTTSHAHTYCIWGLKVCRSGVTCSFCHHNHFVIVTQWPIKIQNAVNRHSQGDSNLPTICTSISWLSLPSPSKQDIIVPLRVRDRLVVNEETMEWLLYSTTMRVVFPIENELSEALVIVAVTPYAGTFHVWAFELTVQL